MNGYYIKPCTSVYSPSHIVSVIIESRECPVQSSRNRYTSEMIAAHVRCAHKRRGQWGETEPYTFQSGQALHDWLETWAQPRVRTYVVTPIASVTLTQTGFWGRLTGAGAAWDRSTGVTDARLMAESGSVGYRVSTMVLRGVPDIVRLRRADRGICWLSGRQYLTSSEEEIGRCVGYRWPETGQLGRELLATTRRPGERAGLWLRAVQHLADWWVSVRGGPWGLTVGQLAMHYFRSRLSPRSVLSHADPAARKLEEGAIFGGRASVYCLAPVGSGADAGSHTGRADPAGTGRAAALKPGELGIPALDPRGRSHEGELVVAPGTASGCESSPPSPYPPISGPVHHVDIRSMYPYLLSDREYPTRLMHVQYRRSITHVRSLLDDYCVIASVRLNARVGEYPRRHRDRIVYQTGDYDTHLCGDELRTAIDSGEVIYVYAHAAYVRGRPFRVMAGELLALRTQARSESRPAWELFVKMLSNTFGGKLAQRRGTWERRPDMYAEREWGEWMTLDLPERILHRYRALAGLVWEHTTDTQSGRQLGACFAYLTMYGRLMMRSLRQMCPTRSIVSQDTDGMWVLGPALSALRLTPSTTDAPPGTLRYVCWSARGVWYSPRHYWTDDGWTLAGYHDPVRVSDGLTFTDRYMSSPVLGSPQAPPTSVTVSERTTTLRCLHLDGVPDPDGWVHPRYATV